MGGQPDLVGPGTDGVARVAGGVDGSWAGWARALGWLGVK